MRDCHQRQPPTITPPTASPTRIQGMLTRSHPSIRSNCSLSERYSSTTLLLRIRSLQRRLDLLWQLRYWAFTLPRLEAQRFQTDHSAGQLVLADDQRQARPAAIRAAELGLEIAAPEVQFETPVRQRIAQGFNDLTARDRSPLAIEDDVNIGGRGLWLGG